MPPTYFPLRWESTGDQWWYATPIDYAAANSQYELVRELLRIDSNNLMKLTSLRRIRRLETVWDDDSQFHDVAACRSRVAKKLLAACDDGGVASNRNTLIRSGYGGWLMYTAASAGDIGFVGDLLERNPLLVFGEGEYGVTDILYAAARSKNDDVFRLIYDFAVCPRFSSGGFDQQIGEIPAAYKREMKNRAVHSASRGGNLIILRELLSECSDEDVLAFRDKQGSTILHAAAGKGKTQVVKELVASYGLITDAIDNQGNTALHVAAYRGHADLVEALISASPSLVTARNKAGDTFLHAGISGFQTPAFERLDKHTELMNRLITSAASKSPCDVVNYRNNEGRTALHLAISGNVPLELVEMLMSVKSIDINIRDASGMTPLDLIRHKPQSPTSDLLFRRLVSAGGMFSCRDESITSVVASHLKDRGNFYSPGARFRTSDAEIFLSSGLEAVPDKIVPRHLRSSSCSIEIGQVNVTDENHHLKKCRNSSVNSATERLKSVFHWPRIKKQPGHSKNDSEMSINSTALESQETPVPLRQRFSKSSTSSPALPNNNNTNNKRTLSVRSNQSSPRAKKKRFGSMRSRSSSFSKISIHSCSTSSSSSVADLKQKGVLIDTNIAGPSGLNPVKSKLAEKQGSVRRRLKSHYFCFGASALSVKTPATVLV